MFGGNIGGIIVHASNKFLIGLKCVIDRLFLSISGILLISLSLTWDLLQGNPQNFGAPQAAMMAVGLFILILGIQPSRMIRINFYVLCGLAAAVLLLLELFVSKSYSQLNINSARDFDRQLDKFNKEVVFSKNVQKLGEHGLENELGFVYKMTSNVNLTQKSGFRIVVLGDSFVMGDGVAWGGTWDALGIKYLEYLAPDIEMISFGRNGATTEDQFKFLMSNINLLNPDLVVFSYVSNDPHFKENEKTKIKDRITFIEINAKTTGYPYRLKSLNFIYERVNNLFVSYYPFYGYEGWTKRLYENENFDAFENLIEQTKAASMTHEFEILFYIFPSISYQSTAYQGYLTQVLNTLNDNQIGYLSPLSHYFNAIHTFSGEYLKANPGDPHPGMLTNFLAARYYISHLCDEDVLPPECVNYRIETMDTN